MLAAVGVKIHVDYHAAVGVVYYLFVIPVDLEVYAADSLCSSTPALNLYPSHILCTFTDRVDGGCRTLKVQGFLSKERVSRCVMSSPCLTPWRI